MGFVCFYWRLLVEKKSLVLSQGLSMDELFFLGLGQRACSERNICLILQGHLHQAQYFVEFLLELDRSGNCLWIFFQVLVESESLLRFFYKFVKA